MNPPPGRSRRNVFAAVAWLVLFAPPAAAQAPLPDVFPAIPEVRALRHVAALELDVVSGPVGDPVFEYGGILDVAPTIRVAPGDRIELTVHNVMRTESGRPNNVNVHFHGLSVAPKAPGDDVLGTLARPGETLHYVVKVPARAEPGLYWYHPHAHGETYRQVTNGMSGAIVVEGLQRHLPALARMRERIVVLRDVPLGPGFADEDMPMQGMAGQTARPAGAPRKTTNGTPCRAENQLQPTLNRQPRAQIGIAPGERQFFRVVNAAAARYFDLSVDGSSLALVAQDGVPLDAFPGTPPVRVARHLLLAPGARAEFVVTGPSRPSVLRSACFDSGPTGDADPALVLADLVAVADGGGPAARAPLDLAHVGTPLPRNVLSQPLPAPAVRRTLGFSEDANGFYIERRAFAPNDPPLVVARSGTVEQWTLLNESDEVHAFHIHQVHFAVDSLDGIANQPRNWVDTVSLPPRTRRPGGAYAPGRVVVTIDFRDPIVRGTFVFHCHILDHEDQGMMAKIRVI